MQEKIQIALLFDLSTRFNSVFKSATDYIHAVYDMSAVSIC